MKNALVWFLFIPCIPALAAAKINVRAKGPDKVRHVSKQEFLDIVGQHLDRALVGAPESTIRNVKRLYLGAKRRLDNQSINDNHLDLPLKDILAELVPEQGGSEGVFNGEDLVGPMGAAATPHSRLVAGPLTLIGVEKAGQGATGPSLNMRGKYGPLMLSLKEGQILFFPMEDSVATRAHSHANAGHLVTKVAIAWEKAGQGAKTTTSYEKPKERVGLSYEHASRLRALANQLLAHAETDGETTQRIYQVAETLRKLAESPAPTNDGSDQAMSLLVDKLAKYLEEPIREIKPFTEKFEFLGFPMEIMGTGLYFANGGQLLLQPPQGGGTEAKVTLGNGKGHSLSFSFGPTPLGEESLSWSYGRPVTEGAASFLHRVGGSAAGR